MLSLLDLREPGTPRRLAARRGPRLPTFQPPQRKTQSALCWPSQRTLVQQQCECEGLPQRRAAAGCWDKPETGPAVWTPPAILADLLEVLMRDKHIERDHRGALCSQSMQGRFPGLGQDRQAEMQARRPKGTLASATWTPAPSACFLLPALPQDPAPTLPPPESSTHSLLPPHPCQPVSVFSIFF